MSMTESPRSHTRPLVGDHPRYAPNLKLKRARESKGWSQADVADKIGAQPNLVTRWERGYAFPSPYYRQKLCDLFEKTTAELGLIREARTDELQSCAREAILPEEQNNVEVHTSPLPREKKNQRVLSRRAFLGGAAVGALAGGAVTFWGVLARRSVPPAVRASSASPLVYTYHTHPPTGINDVAWSPHGTWIACANGDKTAQILEATTGQARITYRGHTGFVNHISWSPDQEFIASASADTTVQIWNPTNGSPIFTYHGHRSSVWCAAWSPDGTLLASGGRAPAIQVWDALNGHLITTYRGHTKGVWMIAWSPDGQSLASCGEDGTIQVWEALTGRQSDTFIYQGDRNSTFYEIAWSPDGKRLASASADTTVQIWDALTGGHMLTLQGHTGSVQTVKWSPDGTLLASGSLDQTVCIWDARTGKQRQKYPYHSDEVYAVSWAPGGHLLASGSKDATMQVYRLIF
jgi:transcriptional regulator with XRE-family HTH domain/Tol biopolymer transport system component